MKRFFALMMAMVLLVVSFAGCIEFPSDSSSGQEYSTNNSGASSHENSSKSESSKPAPAESSTEVSREESKGNIAADTRLEAFDDFVDRQFIDYMSDYVTMHVYLAHPENYGINREEITPDYGWRPDAESMATMHDGEEEEIAEFEAFNRDELTVEQQVVYDVIKYEVELAKRANDPKFDYYSMYFKSASGLHYQLATLFADWKLHDEQEAEELVALMEDTKPYIDAVLEYTRKQEEMGLLMIDLDSVIEHCEGILETGMDSSVLTSINEKIDELDLGEEKTADYKARMADAFEQSFLPAYQDICDAMKEFKANGKNNELGLAALPDGKEYYEILLQDATGVELSVEEIKELIVKESEDVFNELVQLVSKYPLAYQAYYSDQAISTGFDTYSSILDYIDGVMKKDFPDVGEIDYNIVDISEEIASDSGTAAYFNIPQLDGDDTREMRVNPKNAGVNTLDVFNTVAHEGFPGHMYQYAYAYQNIDSPYLLACTDFSGYTEGYAVYASYVALDYLNGFPDGYLQIWRDFELYTYYAMLISDIGIHYEGWDLKEFNDYLTEYGFQMDINSAKGQYMQLQANPTIFMPYYFGNYMIMQMRQKAEDALGSKFSLIDFHKALLKDGAVPFSMVQANVDEYVASVK
ncbi:MAG: DUF885 domain-containing protein [Firmicutes bacterium]|nr:DUF885 domain-containing protein [Bacillota bacterium]